MADSHTHLDITEGEWQAFRVDLRASLDRFAGPPVEREALFA